MAKALTHFLESIHEQGTIQDKKLIKGSPSERERPIRKAALHAAQMLLAKPTKPEAPQP
jgi:hypothetical protein